MTDWNAMPDEDFRQEVRAFFAKHYPEHLRYPAHRLHWNEIGDWYLTLSKHGWIAPAWPVEHGGMGLDPGKLIIFIEEQEAHGVARTPDQGVIMVGPLLIQQGQRRAEEALPAEDSLRRAYLVSGLFRAEFRFGPRQPAHRGRARRQRFRRQRPEDMVDAGAGRHAHVPAWCAPTRPCASRRGSASCCST
jgi:alkylation response protein AidB-like acyl-CoA dehydrogenase